MIRERFLKSLVEGEFTDQRIKRLWREENFWLNSPQLQLLRKENTDRETLMNLWGKTIVMMLSVQSLTAPWARRFFKTLIEVSLIYSVMFSSGAQQTVLCVSSVASVVSGSLWPHGLYPTRLLCPWGSPGRNTGVGCHDLLHGIFLTRILYILFQILLHCRWLWNIEYSSLSYIADLCLSLLYTVKVKVKSLSRV